MSKARVAVLQVITKQLTVTQAAADYGYSRRHLQRLLARYREGGLEAVDPQSRRPHNNPRTTPAEVREAIIEIRGQLSSSGWDAGPVTIAWHLEQAGLHVPSTSTIRRVLHAAGLISPEPRKRPRASYLRFEAAQPNECWQSDFTHWQLADGTDVEIINWLDDHSRYLLSATAHTPVTGDVVVDTFLAATNEHGLPASTLTDNGRVYTTRHGHGRNAFEYLLAALRIVQKNGKPNHPQTQGKAERVQRTEKQWLAQQPRAETTEQLQTQLDAMREHYNHHRPHRSLDRRTPAQAYQALPKAAPPTTGEPHAHYRLRRDRVDAGGKISIRRAGRMHHLGIGRAHHGTTVLAIADDTTITVINLRTSEILSRHDIDPTRSYWPNTQRAPGRWPEAPQP